MHIKSPPVDNDSGDSTEWFEKNLYDVMINKLERDDVVGARLRSHAVTVVTEEKGSDNRGF